MKKIISLIISGILMISMVGCGNKKVLQEQIDIFESINKQDVNTNSVEEYCDSFNIEGLEVYYYPSVNHIIFRVEIDENIYHQFQKDIKELGLEKAREKYGVDELNENIKIVYYEQQGIVEKIDKDTTIQCVVSSDRFCNYHHPIMIDVHDGQTVIDGFKKQY